MALTRTDIISKLKAVVDSEFESNGLQAFDGLAVDIGTNYAGLKEVFDAYIDKLGSGVGIPSAESLTDLTTPNIAQLVVNTMSRLIGDMAVLSGVPQTELEAVLHMDDKLGKTADTKTCPVCGGTKDNPLQVLDFTAVDDEHRYKTCDDPWHKLKTAQVDTKSVLSSLLSRAENNMLMMYGPSGKDAPQLVAAREAVASGDEAAMMASLPALIDRTTVVMEQQYPGVGKDVAELVESKTAAVPENHSASVETTQSESGETSYFAKCSCGWQSSTTPSRDEAQAKADAHNESKNKTAALDDFFIKESM